MQRTHTDQQPIWQTTLGEGCQLTVLQTAQAQQAAVALSFAAGSHHEPAQYLGMAHFLEHLVFRGSEKYAADDGLMAFIQRHAGQVNAQTQGQQTLFHFQVDAPLLQDALARLVDMLTAPLLSSELLRTEREVINEEFALYCRTPQVLMDAALAPCLLAEHPLQRFYAGNRYTLDIESKDFAQALHGFHQRAYLRSALKIVLVLPQPWELWQAELLHTLGPLACTPRNLSVPSLPKLQVERTAAVRLSLPMNERHWVLHVPINQAGLGLAELAEKTQHALALSTGQTFLNIARQHGWCTDISVRASFSAQEQGVLSIYFRGASGEQAVLFEAFIQWMQQWQQVLQSPPQQAYERQAQANRWLLASPLQQAQQVLVHGWPLQQGISAKCLAALDAVLGALTIGAVVQVQAGPEVVSGHYDYGLPLQVQRAEALSANVAKSAIEFDFTREVNTAVERYSAAKEETVILSGQLLTIHQAALCHYQPPCLPDTVAVCYWGWAVANAQVLAQCLAQHLAAVSEVLSYNAVDWQAECTQTMLFIRLSGPANYLPVAANRLLTALEASFVVQPQQPRAPFALRRLLQRLPTALAGAWPVTEADSISMLALAAQPQSALWLGGTEASLQALELRFAKRLQPIGSAPESAVAASGWQQIAEGSAGEALLVLYIPLPASKCAAKDRLRLLNQVVAQYLQQALQYYLRDEKGLCYAVFAQSYAQGDYEGLTCAVQSSKVGAARLLAEIKYCLADLLQRLANDWAGLKADLEALKNQLAQGDLGYEQLSVILFRHWREQRLHTGLLAEVEAQQQLSFEVFAEYCQALQDTQRWLLLSNQPRN